MYSQIMTDIGQDYYQQYFANDGQRFVAWYLQNIHRRDPIQARDDITDGADDKQIDAIFVDDEKSTVFVIQGKFIGAQSIDAAPLREVLSAWFQMRDLDRLQEVCNNRLKQKLSEVAKALEDEYEVCFELITTAELTESARSDLATFQKQLAELSDRDEFSATLMLVNEDEIRRRYDIALERENPSLSHTLDLSVCQKLDVTLAGTKVVLAVVPLSECIKFPGIKDGTLFRKNVRQSLGLNNTVNKGIKNTIYGDRHRDFFFFHNGITAICNRMEQEANRLHLQGVSVVNGCQSLNTILSCSERVRNLADTSLLFRFYEIPQRDRADKISINTNSQSAVKPRDLRSNDRRVLNLKRTYEQDAKVFKAFCDENRLRILERLRGGERCACKLTEDLNIGQSALSYHMKILVESGVVAARQEGKWTHYSLCEAGSAYALSLLRAITTPQETQDDDSCCNQ